MACGAPAPRTESVSPSDAQFASKRWDEILPDGVGAVLALDVSALARSPLYTSGSAPAALIRPLADLTETLRRCNLTSSEASRIVVAQYSAGRNAVIATGSITEARATQCVTRILEPSGAKLQPARLAGRVVYHSSNDRDHLWLAVPVAGVVILANKRALLRDILDPSTDRIARSGSWLEARAKTIDQSSTAWLVFQLDRVSRSSELLALVGLASGLKDLREVSATIRVGEGVDLFVGLGFPDRAQASRAHEFLDTTRELMRLSPPYAKMIGSIGIALNASDVALTVSLTADQLQSLFGTVTGGGQDSDAP